MSALRLASLCALMLTSSCALYFGDDDDDCPYGGYDTGGSGAEAPAVGLHNPETGQCEYGFGGGRPPYPCDDRCGPCDQPAVAEADYAAPPSWGYCESECTGLDEASCLESPGCRGIYAEPYCGDGVSCDGYGFVECWSVDQSGPIQGECIGLDAYACSMHDDCIAKHESVCSGPEACSLGGFQACYPEPIDDAGACWGEVNCRSLPPECPTDTTPGIANGCWTGGCIPLDECEGAPPACSTLGSEMGCVGRTDCTPYYRGEDCACSGDDCSCTWVFDHCAG